MQQRLSSLEMKQGFVQLCGIKIFCPSGGNFILFKDLLDCLSFFIIFSISLSVTLVFDSTISCCPSTSSSSSLMISDFPLKLISLFSLSSLVLYQVNYFNHKEIKRNKFKYFFVTHFRILKIWVDYSMNLVSKMQNEISL